MKVVCALLLLFAWGCGGHTAAKSNDRKLVSFFGITRDLDSGDPIATASIRFLLNGKPIAETESNGSGLYQALRLPPGTYKAIATFADHRVEISNIGIRAGEARPVDFGFHLLSTEPVLLDYNNAAAGRIHRWNKPALGQVAKIVGTITDVASGERIAGASVFLTVSGTVENQLTTTDELGKYEFDAVAPGTYDLSASYSLNRRINVEMRRTVTVAAGDSLLVPLWIEAKR